MTEGRVAEIVGEGDGFRQWFVELERHRHAARDLRHFQRMCQARAVQITFVIHKHLGLVHEPAESGRMDNAVAVTLVFTAIRRW